MTGCQGTRLKPPISFGNEYNHPSDPPPKGGFFGVMKICFADLLWSLTRVRSLRRYERFARCGIIATACPQGNHNCSQNTITCRQTIITARKGIITLLKTPHPRIWWAKKNLLKTTRGGLITTRRAFYTPFISVTPLYSINLFVNKIPVKISENYQKTLL